MRSGDLLRRLGTIAQSLVAVLVVGVVGGLVFGFGSAIPRFMPADHGGHLDALPVAATVAQAPTLNRTGWTATASSAESAAEQAPAANVLDGSATTIWHSVWSTGTPALPQSITLDMKTAQTVSALVYTPRSGSSNGRIGQYQISLSTNGTTWATPIATGTWADDNTVKTAAFAESSARYIRLTAVSEAANRGPWASAAEINVLGASTASPTATPTTAAPTTAAPTTAAPTTAAPTTAAPTTAAPTTAAPTTAAPTTAAPTGTPTTLSRTGWTASASSTETSAEVAPASNVLDGSATTIWHSVWSTGAPALPQSITLDMKATSSVSGLSYTPRADSANGRIGQYQVSVSADGATWGAPVATGTWADTAAVKTASFTAVSARYVRLTSVTEAGNRGPWAAVAELNVTGVTSTPPTTVAPTTVAPTTAAPTTVAPTTVAPTTVAPTGTPTTLSRTGWTASASSAETSSQVAPASNVLDGSTTTIWHSVWSTGSPVLPQSITLDMKAAQTVSALTYTPRTDSANGRIGQYQVSVSADGATWGAPVATGTWADTAAVKTASFTAVSARFIRLSSVTEAGNRGPWAAVAELNVTGISSTPPTTAGPTTPAPTTVAPTTTAAPTPTATSTQPPAATVKLARTNFTVTASDSESVAEAAPPSNAIDSNKNTFWHSNYSDTTKLVFPHSITIDTHDNLPIAGLSYLPRSDSPNGRIGRYDVYLSNDGTNWTASLASGTWSDFSTERTVTFPTRTARYVKLVAGSEAGNRENITAAAELYVLGPTAAPVTDPSKVGAWGNMIGFPVVPVAAALLPNNRMLVWSAAKTDDYQGSNGGQTWTSILNLTTGDVSQKLVTNTGHDMFCPGVAILPDGRIMVTGGTDSGKTSIYDPSTDAWTAGPNMQIGRGYAGQTLLQDGRVFTIGGSWSGGLGGKVGEVWSATGGWTKLTGATTDAILTQDGGGIYRADNHAWLFPVSGGRLLHAGPSRQMNWITTAGAGTITPAGVRGDNSAMNGNAVMFDKDKILTLGGADNYSGGEASKKAYVLDASASTLSVTPTGDMKWQRALQNSVVLPDGSVLTMGGQESPDLFSDERATQAAELWTPSTGNWTTMAQEATPRTYHSVGLLLPDGRVFSGGGGLCGNCTTNHPDGQIFTPPYLLNADGSVKSRPVLSGTPGTAAAGSSITVTTDKPVTKFALVRYGESTHSVNNDQRRVSLSISSSTGNSYTLAIPGDKGVVLPGPYMLFAMDANGVPSVSQTVFVN